MIPFEFEMKPHATKQHSNVANLFQQGQRAIQLGLLEQAEALFLSLINTNPQALEAHAFLAFIYASKNLHKKAIAHLNILLKARINTAQTHHNLGNSLYALKRYDASILHFESAIALDAKRIDSMIACAASHRILKNHSLAIGHLHSALNIDKSNHSAFHLLGIIYAETLDYARALECLQNATGLAPSNVAYRLCFANVLEKAFLIYDAEYQYHIACESNPDHRDAFVMYGDFLLKNLYHDEALECFKRAQQLKENVVSQYNQDDILNLIVTTYLGMGDTNTAITILKDSLSISPNQTKKLELLGKAYQDAGKLAEALDIAEKLIKLDDNHQRGYILRSRVSKSLPNDGLAEALLARIPNISEEKERIFTYFALGKIFNDHKDYENAFKHYAKGNQLANNQLSHDKHQDEARVSDLINAFNATFISAHNNLGIDSSTPVVIVGMPRSGTTLTEQIISSHPSVVGAGEVAFWGNTTKSLKLILGSDAPYPDNLPLISRQIAHDISNRYESCLHKITGAATKPLHITDKMPHNFLNVGLIALLFPNAKIIHTRRNPLDICLSIFFQHFTPEAHPYAFDLENLGHHYKQYERIMRHWHAVLPGRIMDIQYEDTISDPEFWSRKLIDHIGLEWNDACLAPHKLERTVKTASHWQVRQPIYKTSVQRWKNYEQFLGPLIDALKD